MSFLHLPRMPWSKIERNNLRKVLLGDTLELARRTGCAAKDDKARPQPTILWYITKALSMGLVVIFCKLLFPSLIPYSIFQFWIFSGSTIIQALYVSWPLFLWGFTICFAVSYATRNPDDENFHAEELLFTDFLSSLWAGVAEEICFRWLIFLGLIVSSQFANFLLLGFMSIIGFPGWGLIEITQYYIISPIANFFTLGHLSDIFTNRASWPIASAIIVSTGWFREGHAYQGWIGYLNSWFLGMFFFWMTLTFGLPSAIIVHFLYDFVISCIRYADRYIERIQAMRRAESRRRMS